MSNYLERLGRFALQLRTDAERMDTEAAVLADWYARFTEEGLHLGWSPRQPLSGRDFCEALAILGESSGAFGFVALQQFVANASLADRVPDAMEWPRVGIAFGHLRNPRGPCPRREGDGVTGMAPWLTGAGLFPQVILGLREADGCETYALVDAQDRPAFRHGAPLDIMACSGTCTVSVQCCDLRIEAEAILKVDPSGTFERDGSQGVLYQTPLMVGCVRACMQLIRDSSRVGSSEQVACENAADAILRRVTTAFESGTPEDGWKLRAELGDFSVRLARLATMACGGIGLVRSHPAQRLYREALLYSLMAQNDDIVNQAFQEVFP